MKNTIYTDILFTISFLIIFILSSCDPGSHGNKDTQIDSSQLYNGAPDQTQARPPGSLGNTQALPEGYQTQITTRNAVKIDVEDGTGFNWETFRNRYHTDHPEVGKGATENEALGTWEQWDDQYSYQLVYRIHNDDFWVQTYYREDNATGQADTGTQINVLTIEAAEDLKLAPLWTNMEELAISIQDSIRIHH